ncbi:MAG TPA: hypothetical protein P5081_22045 [Phycisphaerae bacterium]|nr:hypothetical protein [Phycisphaerae bacterium]
MSQTNGNEAAGTLEVMDNGIGYLRDPSKNYAPIGASPQVTRDAIKALRLRGGEYIEGVRGRSRNGGKPILQKVERICGREARQYGAVRPFDELEVVHPVD